MFYFRGERGSGEDGEEEGEGGLKKRVRVD